MQDPHLRIVCMAFSKGAWWVTLLLGIDPNLFDATIWIAGYPSPQSGPDMQRSEGMGLARCSGELLCVAGKSDFFCPWRDYEVFFEALQEARPGALRVLEGGSHDSLKKDFFYGAACQASTPDEDKLLLQRIKALLGLPPQ